jgi:ABC-type antimicrobial peptide transport system permease subunit
MSGTRFRAALFGVFAAVALALAAVGIFGVVAYTVVQRTAEMGVRLALGATPRDVRRLVTVQGAFPVLVGIGAGLLMAVGVSRLMAGFLLRVQPLDPLTFVATAAFLMVIGLLATWVPARRATAVDPATTLRRQ